MAQQLGDLHILLLESSLPLQNSVGIYSFVLRLLTLKLGQLLGKLRNVGLKFISRRLEQSHEVGFFPYFLGKIIVLAALRLEHFLELLLLGLLIDPGEIEISLVLIAHF